MSIEIIAFVFGCVLVLIGIIGGGLEIKEIKIPKIKGVTRIIAIIGGLIFISCGVEFPSPPPSTQSVPDIAVVRQQVKFRIDNELDQGQVSEDLRILIDGRLAASLLVNQERSNTSATITVPHEGNYRYTIFAEGIFMNRFGQTRRSRGRGYGVIEVSEESVFVPVITPHGLRLLPK